MPEINSTEKIKNLEQYCDSSDMEYYTAEVLFKENPEIIVSCFTNALTLPLSLTLKYDMDNRVFEELTRYLLKSYWMGYFYIAEMKIIKNKKPVPKKTRHACINLVEKEQETDVWLSPLEGDPYQLSNTPFHREIKKIEQAVMWATQNKIKSMSAGKMGMSTSEVGDLIAELVSK